MRSRNTGTRPGREVVQVYASRPDSGVDRPTRWLAGFGTATAGPGREVEVEIVLPARALAHWDTESHAWTIEQGRFHLDQAPRLSGGFSTSVRRSEIIATARSARRHCRNRKGPSHEGVRL